MKIAPGFESRSIATDIGTIAYAAPQPEFWPAAAHPDKTLVFLHGFGGGSSSYEWSKVYPAFATDYRVLAPDLPGWGRSEHPARDYQATDYLEAIATFLEKTCPHPPTVIASSLTAGLTIRLAVTRPEAFSRLILVTPAGLSDFGRDFRQQVFPQILRIPFLNSWIYHSAIATSQGIQRFFEDRQFANPQRVTQEMVAAYLESAQQPNAEYAALSFVRGDLCFDLAEYLPQLTVPTTVLWGAQAQLTPLDLGRRLVALNPTAIKHFEVIENVGLTPHLEQPALTIGLIQKALAGMG